MRMGIWMCSGICACIVATAVAGAPLPIVELDVNPGPDVQLVSVPGLCSAPVLEKVPPSIVAMVVLPGPLDSMRLSFEIWNYGNVPISLVNINGFDALGGQGLLFTRASASDGRSAFRVAYPREGAEGEGPIVLGFDGFQPGYCAAFDAEASTWGNPQFHGRVMDVVGARIQVVFADGQRGDGEVVLCGSNGRFARGVPCRSGDAMALISESRTMQVRLSP